MENKTADNENLLDLLFTTQKIDQKSIKNQTDRQNW